MRNAKPLPQFKSEDDERDFWATHDSSEYFDWDKALHNSVFPSLKPSNRTINLRLPEYLLELIKQEANKRDVPYQSLIKTKLYEVFQAAQAAKPA
ncbi:MAG: BrnA antitoxin family protein [Anaerolineales bacterium]|nr:BrnA antitoxin family protein [Anaerolineales bacterium]